jgi:hypothetical protein
MAARKVWDYDRERKVKAWRGERTDEEFLRYVRVEEKMLHGRHDRMTVLVLGALARSEWLDKYRVATGCALPRAKKNT